MTEHERFLADHGIRPGNGFTNYHYAYALYTWYMVESIQMAEEIENGLCFDDLEAAVLLEGLSRAFDAVGHLRRGIQEKYAMFDVAETIAMKGCRLEDGRLVGSVEEAEAIARRWVKDYVKQGAGLFRYEVGIYILFWLRQEVDYQFLAMGRGDREQCTSWTRT